MAKPINNESVPSPAGLDGNGVCPKTGGGLREPIAIVGIGCRFPGGVSGAESFWRLLWDEVDAITAMPSGRFDLDAYYNPEPRAPGKIITRNGGFLRDIEMFDNSFFGISPREADFLDPQQRLLLEVAWEALEDAGIVPASLAGSRTGVYIGEWSNDYEDAIYATGERLDLYTMTGGGRYPSSGRLSYFFDLRGPSVTVDSACSSSAVAVHLACRSLWNRETTVALAGGVNLILTPQITISFSYSGMLSPDGRCKFGDDRADGFVRSEGAGIVALKTLPQARADGNPIYALIRGSAVNNDGRGSGLLVTPSENGQAAMLREAYEDAGISPSRVGYVEAHGTGTPAGDQVELRALAAVVGQGRAAASRCVVGSVKTNIGHSEGAAGIAGLIKAALCLKHRTIPRSLHFEQPSTKVAWSDLPIEIAATRLAWCADDRPAFAGVSAFGITGTNAHIVLEEAPLEEAQQDSPANRRLSSACLIPFSAHTSDALKDMARTSAECLRRSPDGSLSDIAYSQSVRRTHHENRIAVIAHNHVECARRLDSFLRGEPSAGVVMGDADELKGFRTVFVFPGQGSQWFGMSRQLQEREPVFRDTLERCDAAIRDVEGWSLLEQLDAVDTSPAYRLREINVIQPTLVAIEIALAALWRSWGVEPDAVIGHSMGEVAAACMAGALSIEDAFRVICVRSRLLRRVSGRGAMALVELAFDGAREVVGRYEDRVAIAASNSPRSTVLSGDPAAIDAILKELEAKDIFCRPVRVDVASHSPQMDLLLDDLVTAIQGIEPRDTSIPICSTVLAVPIAGRALTPEYWVKNLRQPVLFSRSVQRLLADEHNVFIEMSPQPILLPFIEQTVGQQGGKALTIPSLRRDEPEQETILASLGSLFVAGYSVDWKRLHSKGRFVRMSPYPWQRQRYWFEAAGAKGKDRRAAQVGRHPLLGQRVTAANGTEIWETLIGTESLPYLKDHCVRGRVVFPAAGIIEMALAAASQALAKGSTSIGSVEFHEMMDFSDVPARAVQFILSRRSENAAAFQVFAGMPDEAGPRAWTLHASGTIRVRTDVAGLPSATGDAAPLLQRNGNESVVAADNFYESLADRGYGYGPSFRGVAQVWNDGARIVAELRRPECARTAAYEMQAPLFDAAFQSLLALEPLDSGVSNEMWVPARIESVEVASSVVFDGDLRAVATRRGDFQGIAGDVTLTRNGTPAMIARGVQFARVRKSDEVQDWLYTVGWEPAEPVDAKNEAKSKWLIVDAGDAQTARTTDDDTAEHLAAELIAAGDAAEIVSTASGDQGFDTSDAESAERLLLEYFGAGANANQRRGVICLSSPALPVCDLSLPSIEAAQEHGVLRVLAIAQALAKQPDIGVRLWILTRNTQSVDAARGESISVEQAPIWGLGGVIALEHSETHCTRIDLGDTVSPEQFRALVAELRAEPGEDQVAIRGNQRYAARLKELSAEFREETTRKHAALQGEGYQLEIRKPGMLDELALYSKGRRAAKHGEVELEIHAAGLNFLDVLKAMGTCPGFDPDASVALGGECAGTIVEVGDGVTDFKRGDEVIAITTSFADTNLFANYVTLPELVVTKKPAGLSFEQAASVPLAYLTAYYALDYLARLRKDERVLIHSAAGGVGLAAIYLARAVGAEIFATAGTPEKRSMLRDIGLTHVMDSHSLDFAHEIRTATNGQGIDVVLNSLAGEAIATSLGLLRANGRFLELGKRDIYENAPLGMAGLKKNISFFAIDLADGIEKRPAFFMELLGKVLKQISGGMLQPLPVTSRSITEASGTFRCMAQGGHTGKLVFRIKGEPVEVAVSTADALIRADGTYLITGGSGDLGLEIATWLVDRGARHLALVNRSEPSGAAREAIRSLSSSGANIEVYRADVANRQSIAEVLGDIERTRPPLHGVFHAAGFLRDGMIETMTREQFLDVLAPKVAGAWNLHALTSNAPLDFFVLFSSVAAILGSPGQSNYAAGNAFLDALAHFRRAQGLPALSIDWGPWAKTGLAARSATRGTRLARSGLRSIFPGHGRAALGILLARKAPQAVVMRFDARKWCEMNIGASAAFFRALETTAPASGDEQERGKLLGSLAAADPAAREAVLAALISEQVGRVLRLAPSKIPATKPFKTLGLDSLMTMELRNRLEVSLGLKLSGVVIWNHPTVAKLAPYLASRLQPTGGRQSAAQSSSEKRASEPAASPIEGNESTAASSRQTKIDSLTAAEVADLLEAELSPLDEQKRKHGRAETN
jgi:acyl transferase domain-containing protein/nucleoside-diphosphate-sugar epimerase/acyl carrier protein